MHVCLTFHLSKAEVEGRSQTVLRDWLNVAISVRAVIPNRWGWVGVQKVSKFMNFKNSPEHNVTLELSKMESPRSSRSQDRIGISVSNSPTAQMMMMSRAIAPPSGSIEMQNLSLASRRRIALIQQPAERGSGFSSRTHTPRGIRIHCSDKSSKKKDSHNLFEVHWKYIYCCN